MRALADKDTVSAKQFFLESIKQFSDIESLKELGKIYLNENTFSSRNKAYECFKKAVLKLPDDIESRYLYAKVLEDRSKCAAFCEYKRIVELDITQAKAWFEMAKIKDEEFTEYNHSGNLADDEFFFSLQKYADDNFYKAEKYYIKTLVFEPLNNEALLKLALLYDKAGKPEEGIKYLMRSVNENKADKDVYLCLGLLSYRTKKLEDAYLYYQKAIALMNYGERKDFTFNSVKFILNGKFKDIAEKLDYSELKRLIEIYWKVYDPLYLTDYNERLLEHYSRVAYANLYFSAPQMGKVGWKTDRGEVVLRFGEPINITRLRPQMTGKAVLMKTEVWNYENGLTFGFTDFASSGNYMFSIPAGEKDKFAPQFLGDSQYLIENARRIFPSSYNPKFEGPKFDAPYNIVQFKDQDKSYLTDIYVNYGFNISDSSLDEKKDYKHTVGIYLFDMYYNDIYRTRENVNVDPEENFIKSADSTNLFINSVVVKLKPDAHTNDTVAAGTISFEIMRDADKGVASNRDTIRIRSFTANNLAMSDLLFGYNVITGNQMLNAISRKNVNIFPNPSNSFSDKDKMYLYYEIYNLEKDGNDLTDFEQEVTITNAEVKNRSGLENFLNSVLTFLHLKEAKQSTTLTSHYQTLESNPQIYFQLDMNKYPAGDYLITVSITDNISNKKVRRETVLRWKG